MGVISSKFFSAAVQKCQYGNCMRRKEDMEIPLLLLDLPTEIIEKILLHLPPSEWKNIRLTCKWLYELCNTDRFCKDEQILWSEDLCKYVDALPDLFRIGRSHYNLVIANKTLTEEIFTISPIFEKLSAKIRTLIIHQCNFLPGLLETIIIQCEGLCSLRIGYLYTYLLENPNQTDFFTLEPFSITRPNVTYLDLYLPETKQYDFFHRIFSIFPNLKHLLTDLPSIIFNGTELEKVTEECSFICDDIMKAGCNLERLQLNIPLSQSIIEKNFFEALPNLKQLDVDFHDKPFTDTGEWYPCYSNLVTVILRGLQVFHPPKMIRLLTNPRLKNLAIESKTIVFDEESFKKLVASKLTTLMIHGSSSPPLDLQLEANKSVKVLQLDVLSSTEILFPKYFLGLVHLSLGCATDSILQCIFQYQKNLRSLSLQSCLNCSINGFCGSKTNGFEYSIINLQKLEHLTLSQVLPEVIQSHEFKQAFSFPRLKYLVIECFRSEDRDYDAEPRVAKIPTVLYENLTELRALRLADDAVPSHETLSSLFSSLKHLNYLRYDMDQSSRRTTDSVTFIKVDCEHFTINLKKYKYAYSLAHAYHDKELDRMVILNASLNQNLYMPKISSNFQINWITT